MRSLIAAIKAFSRSHSMGATEVKQQQRETYAAGALRQYAVTPEVTADRLGPGVAKVEVSARGGDVFVSVGNGPQDLSLSGVSVQAGETKTIWVLGDDVQVAVRLAGDDGIAVVQILEFSKVTSEG